MIKSFDFYYDFGSPYTFLAHKKIREIEKNNSTKINYKPILLGGLFKLAGNKANADIPIKAKYMIRDCKLWSEKYKIDFKFSSYFPINTLTLMRSSIVAERKKISQVFINTIFEAIWKNNLNLNDVKILEKILVQLNLDPKKFLDEANDQKIKDELKNKTEEAFNIGIFGSPTFVVNNKIFWGQDRLEFVLNEAKK